MRFIIALLILLSVWFLATIVAWFASGLFSSIQYDEGIMLGWGDDWRNRTSNIIAVILATSLALFYLRWAKSRFVK